MKNKSPGFFHRRFLKSYARSRAWSKSSTDLADLRKKEKALYAFPVGIYPVIHLLLQQEKKELAMWCFMGFLFFGILYMLLQLHWMKRSIDLLLANNFTEVNQLLGDEESSIDNRAEIVNATIQPTKWLIAYLKRFKKQREEWEVVSESSDLLRLRHNESFAHGFLLGQLILLSSVLRDGALAEMLAGDVSWIGIALTAYFSIWTICLLYMLYWSTRSVNLLLSHEETNIETFLVSASSE